MKREKNLFIDFIRALKTWKSIIFLFILLLNRELRNLLDSFLRETKLLQIFIHPAASNAFFCYVKYENKKFCWKSFWSKDYEKWETWVEIISSNNCSFDFTFFLLLSVSLFLAITYSAFLPWNFAFKTCDL
jgi:hypothetical protein